MQTQALDYRAQYPTNPGYTPNPLTVGQWVMIGAGALAVGGLAFWGYQAWKKKSATTSATTAKNPGVVRHHYASAA